MSTFAFLFLCFQACLIQIVSSQCGYYGGASVGNYAGIGSALAAAAPAAVNGGYSGVGDGEVAVVGELPVSGATLVTGQVPVLGAVQFGGSIPASGAVTITGSCSCGCGSNNGQFVY